MTGMVPIEKHKISWMLKFCEKLCLHLSRCSAYGTATLECTPLWSPLVVRICINVPFDIYMIVGATGE